MDLNALDQLYRSATDASTGITFTDGDGIIIHVNNTFSRMTGFDKNEFLGKRHNDVLQKIDETVDPERLAAHFYHTSLWRGEISFIHKDGHIVWTDTTILPVFNAQGGLDGLFTLSLDITEKKHIENQLGINEQKLGFVLDSLQTAFWEWDARTDSAWFNDNWPLMLGYQPGDVPKNFRGWADFVHPEDKERGTQEMIFHIKNKTPALVCIQRFRHKSGRWVHVMTKGRVAERDENDRAVRFIGVNHDISAINRLEQFSLHIQDLAKLGVWDVELNTRSPHWSKKTYEIFGINPDNVPPPTVEAYNLFHPEYINKVQTAFNLLASEGIPYDLEVPLKNNRWVRIAGRTESYEGKPYRAFGIVQDIHEQKVAAEVLRTSQETLRLALDAGDFGVWDWDIQKNRAYWNPKMRELFGQSQEQEFFSFEDSRTPIHPDDKERVDKECQRSLEEKDRCDSTYRVVIGDSTRWVRAIGKIERNHLGEKYRMIGICWDVTRQVELQQVQTQAIETAKKAINMKSQFMATVSHEIRTPMSGVIGMTELLSETNLSAEQREIVQTIKTCGENLLTLVNDILDYSKLEANKVALSIRPFRLADTIKNTLDLFQYKARQKSIKLQFSIDPSVSEFVSQDETRLYQVLFNLIGNAVKFTLSGSINVNVTRKNENLYFDVQDTGIGIPKDKLEVIFDSFTQLNPGTVGDSAGTGLGLSISRSLIELMGGDISVRSQENIGSTFSFYIHAPKVLHFNNQDQDKNKYDNSIENLSVLLVEDNPINLKLMVSILERLKLHVDVAEDGEIAVEKAKAFQYDLIFMDIQMPKKNGLQATKEIRNLNLEKRPYIIALTANVSSEHKDECFQSGMDDFLAKPIRVQMIRNQLKYYASKVDSLKQNNRPTSIVQANVTLLDKEKLKQEFSGFEDLLQEFCQIFLSNHTSYLQEIEQNLVKDDLIKTAKAAHALKGVLSNFQSKSINQFLIELERFALEGNKKSCQDCFIDLTKVMNLFVKEVSELNQSL